MNAVDDEDLLNGLLRTHSHRQGRPEHSAARHVSRLRPPRSDFAPPPRAECPRDRARHDAGESGRAKQRLHRLRLVVAVLDDEAPPGTRRARAADDDAQRREPIHARRRAPRRARSAGRLPRDAGRRRRRTADCSRSGPTAPAGDAGIPVGCDELDVGRREPLRIGARDRERRVRRVGRDAPRLRPLVRERQRNGARTGAQVEHAHGRSRGSWPARTRRASPFPGAESARPA